jgi:hypothetical protein
MSLGQVVLTPAERKELERRARSRSLASELVKRAKVILMLADCHSYSEVRRKIACTDRYISGWKLRFQLERLAGWILVIVAPGTADAPRRPKRGF